MASLSSIEKMKFEKLFDMNSGYVLDFTNRTFYEFFLENVGVDIFDKKYDYASGSKANRLRGFWNVEGNVIVGKVLLLLVERWKVNNELNGNIVPLLDKALYEECFQIAEGLARNMPGMSSLKKDLEFKMKKEQEAKQEYQLGLLLKMFDDLSLSTDLQRRGFLLQDLLNRMFVIHDIPVTQSFQRNGGGEQIDGAFSFQGWHYLVECKWTKKLADIRELDSLYGKVTRSGRQAMGLFLSIEGWSENVPPLLKQNTEKCIILMEGYDLRSIFSGSIKLETLLSAKIAKLNIASEPFLSALEILKGSNERA